MNEERTGTPTPEEWALIREYTPLFYAEYLRIGFTEHDFQFGGSGGPIRREALEAELAELRAVPSGIGAVEYYRRLGVDLEAPRRRVGEDPPGEE